MSHAGIAYNPPVGVFGGILLLFKLYLAVAKEKRYTYYSFGVECR